MASFFIAAAAVATNGFEVRAATLDDTYSTGAWTDFTFLTTFTDTPLVFAIATSTGGDPCTIRITDVTTSGFRASCLEPTGEDGPHVDMDFHFLAVEPGLSELPLAGGGTLLIEAGFLDTTTVQHNCASGCGTPGWESVAFDAQLTSALGSPPAVLTQIQDLANESNSGADASSPHLSTVIASGSITTSGFDVALERSECNAGSVASDERIGWLAIPEGSTCRSLDVGGGSSVLFEAILTGEVIDGWTSGCNAGEGASFTCSYASPPVTIASKSSREGGDGGWLRRCSLTAAEVRFDVDEDTCRDGERGHIDEAASIVAFGGDVAMTVPTLVSVADFAWSDDGVTASFQWTTTSEVGTAGFRLLQGTARGQLEPVISDLLPAHLSSPQGSHYRLDLESRVSPSGDRFSVPQARSFWIEEQERTGARRLYGPFRVEASALALEREAWEREGDQVLSASLSGGATWSYRARKPVRVTREPISAMDHGKSTGVTGATNDRGLVEIIIEQDGLYAVSLGELAKVFDVDLDVLRRELKNGKLRGSFRGHPVPWSLDAGGGLLLFWGAVGSDPLVPRSVYRFERNRLGPVMETREVVGLRGDFRGISRAAVSFERDDIAVLVLPQDPESDFWMWTGLHSSFSSLVSVELPFELDGLAADGEDLSLELELLGASTGPGGLTHRLSLSVGGFPLGQVAVLDFDRKRFEVTVPLSAVQSGENILSLDILAPEPSDDPMPSLVFVDGFEVAYTRTHETRRSSISVEIESRDPVRIGGFQPGDEMIVLDLGSPAPDSPESQVPNLPAVVVGFESWTETEMGESRQFAGFFPRPGATYVATTRGAWLTPLEIRAGVQDPLTPRDVSSLGDVLIVSPASLLDGAHRLADHRRALDGLATDVVSLEQIYDYQAWGHEDPRALRDFVFDLLEEAPLPPSYLVLLGSGHYDYAGRLDSGANLMPPLFLSTRSGLFASDSKVADTDGDGIPEIPVGRIPVDSADQLEQWLDKLEAFERVRDSAPFPSSSQGVQGRTLLVGDVPDEGGNFTAGVAQLETALTAGQASLRSGPDRDGGPFAGVGPSWTTRSVSLAGRGSGDVRSELLESWDDGWDWIFWMGHGAVDRWSNTGFFRIEEVESLSRSEHLPIVATPSCNTHRFELPGFDSLGGSLVSAPEGGAIASIGPTGTAHLSSAVALSTAWATLQRRADSETRLGDLIVDGMERAAIASGLQLTAEEFGTYVLFGDPSMRVRAVRP